MDIAQEMSTTLNDNPDLLKKVITDDQAWLYGYDIETKGDMEIKGKSKQILLAVPKEAF